MISMMMFYLFPAQLPFLLSQQGPISGVAIGIALSMAAFSASIVAFGYGGAVLPTCADTGSAWSNLPEGRCQTLAMASLPRWMNQPHDAD